MSASAISFYGLAEKGVYSECDSVSPMGETNWMVWMTKQWEESALRVGHTHGCRVALLRIGAVLGKEGGFFPKIKQQYRLCELSDDVIPSLTP